MLKKADYIYILNAFNMCNNKHQKSFVKATWFLFKTYI